MEVLSTNRVLTRKSHVCSACGRLFPSGTDMIVQAVADGGSVHSWRQCMTCTELLKLKPKLFADNQDIFDEFCVQEVLHNGEYPGMTPEDLLKHFKGE